MDIKKFKAGDYFGELALMQDAPRVASVFADTDCTCLIIDKDNFKRLLSPIEEVLKQKISINEHEAV
jgi:cAMP-dependent protein kinase regulator